MKKSTYLIALALGASTITFAQNVGINTDGSDPDSDAILHINNHSGSSADSSIIRIENEQNGANDVTGVEIYNSGTGATAKWDIYNPASGSTDLRIKGNGSDHVTIQNDGDVGISTTTPASGLDVQTSMGLAHAVVNTTPVTLDQDDNVVLVDDAGADRTINLPPASSNSGKVYYIKKTNSSENEITIDGNSTETIDGALTVVLYVQYDAIRILCDGANWHIIADERIPHRCLLERNTAQSISNNTVTDINFNNELIDVGGIGDPTTNFRIDIKRAGDYLITGFVALPSIDDQDNIVTRIKINGANRLFLRTSLSDDATGNRDVTGNPSGVFNLSAGDFVEISVWHNEGSAIDTRTLTSLKCSLSVQEIR